MVQVDGYEDLVEIGRGGFAVVYRARQPAFGRDVALKVLTSPARDDADRKRFERECLAMGRLSWHPNIVVVHDAGTTGAGLPYLAMEFLEGGSLGDRLDDQGPLSWQEAVDHAVRLAGALHTAHAGGLLHRDVKPDNALVDAFGRVKLADFGIASLAGTEITATGLVTATIAHAAPEIIEGTRATPLSDVYSLGSTLFELLAGTAAFVRPGDESLVPVIRRTASDPVPDLRPRGVPAPVADTLESAMAKDTMERPDALSLGRRLQDAQRHLGVAVTDLPVKGRSRPVEAPPVADTAPGAPTAPRGAPVTDPSGPSAPVELRGPATELRTDRSPAPARRPRWWAAVAAALVVLAGSGVAGYLVLGNGAGNESAATALGIGDETWAAATGGPIVSSPLLTSERVVVGSDDESVHAYDAATGEEQWRVATSGPVRATPTHAGGVVYVGSFDGNLYALDATDGSERWRAPIGFEVFSSPTVDGDTVYVGGDGLHALEAATGDERWVYDTGGPVNSSPEVAGGSVFVGSDAGVVHAVDAGTGEQRWQFETGGPITSSPAVVDGQLFVGSNDGSLYALDAASGEEQWRYTTDDGINSSPAVREDLVFVGSRDGNLYAVAVASGRERWRFTTGDRVESSPTVLSRTVYVGSNDGHLYALDATSGEERWRFESGGPVVASPAAASERVIVASSDGSLYAVRRPSG